jgi:syntaxin 16
VVELKRLHADRIKAALKDPTELEMRIDALTRDITSKFTGAGRRLRGIASSAGTMGDKKTSDMSIKTNIQRSLATSLQAMSSDFRKMQRRYLAEVNRSKKASSFDALIGSSAASAAGEGGGDDVDTVRPDAMCWAETRLPGFVCGWHCLQLSLDPCQAVSSLFARCLLGSLELAAQGFTEEQIEALASAETSVQERDEEIAQIARSIQELSDLFKDLNVLIVDQGTLLDRIDHNVDLTLDSVKAGVKHLETSEKYQKSARPFKCIAVLMFMIIVMIIIIAVRHSNG